MTMNANQENGDEAEKISSNYNSSLVVAKLQAPVAFGFQPIGRWYEAHCLRCRQKKSLSELSAQSSSSSDNGDVLSEDEDNAALLLSLDPKEWKNQDHYAVLGVGKLRYRATEQQLKRAYKKKVLSHHPDKRRARGLPVKEGDDDYFTCITRAYEVLGNRMKRRSFDSIDPEFDDSIPANNAPSKEKFFEVFRPVFVQNARFSNLKNVPLIGDENSTHDYVCDLYAFWYDFNSWREFSYLDEEEKEKGENREERRWIEKQNKAARQKRKKEEIARIRQLIDNAYACDPRIARFKEEEKSKKEAYKRAKIDAAKARADEEKRKRDEKEEEERKLREKEDEEARIQAAAVKKEKEAQKKLFKKERKTLRTLAKDFNYFADTDKERVENMLEVEKLAELLALASLESLNEALSSGDKDVANQIFQDKIIELRSEQEKERERQHAAAQKHASEHASQNSKKQWGEQETQMLIKAVNLFPAGTKDRWEVIANFITQHVPESNRGPKEVLAKAKELQKNDFQLKEDASKKAFQRFQTEYSKPTTVCKPQGGEISERVESVAEQQIRETGSNPAPWTADEQKLLEQSLKTFPASTADRWERIADTVPSRSKKDCMKRYKELVEMVKAKKAAQDATAKAKKS